MQVFVACFVNEEFENEILYESTDLSKVRIWIEEKSKTFPYPIILDWYYVKEN